MSTERRAAVVREISKVHEETVRGTLDELARHFTANEPRGEIVFVIEGWDGTPTTNTTDTDDNRPSRKSKRHTQARPLN